MKRIDIISPQWATCLHTNVIIYSERDYAFIYSEIIAFSDRLLRDVTHGTWGGYTYIYFDSYNPFCLNKQLKCQNTYY